MSQTAVTMTQKKARAGQIAHAFTAADVRSLAAEGAVPFGLLVVKGTKATQTKVPASASDVLQGFSVATHALESQSGSADPGYAAKQAVNVLTFGTIWVKVLSSARPSVDGAVYGVVGTANAGMLTSTSTSNIDLAAKIRVLEVDTTLNLALIQLREHF